MWCFFFLLLFFYDCGRDAPRDTEIDLYVCDDFFLQKMRSILVNVVMLLEKKRNHKKKK